MVKLTYPEAYDKIIQAYFNDEIKPYETKFCFCGTLAAHNLWCTEFDPYRIYSYDEYAKMEVALLKKLECYVFQPRRVSGGVNYTHPDYEEKLFNGMSAALEVLKQIHIERGEIIDEVPVFTKRELAHT